MTRTYKRPNFERLRQIPIEKIVARLGIPLEKKGSQYRAKCPLCSHPSKRAFVVTPMPVNMYFCFGRCQSGGDALTLYARVRRMTLYQAACELEQTLGLP